MYVSARYTPPDATGMMPDKEGARPVIATDENGVEWHLTEDSQVGDWLRFLETEPTIAEYEPLPAEGKTARKRK